VATEHATWIPIRLLIFWRFYNNMGSSNQNFHANAIATPIPQNIHTYIVPNK